MVVRGEGTVGEGGGSELVKVKDCCQSSPSIVHWYPMATLTFYNHHPRTTDPRTRNGFNFVPFQYSWKNYVDVASGCVK